ncbi:hypothetical protein WBG78_13120 [Chryseolinea sp. T2]|uniref:hypothetical protein n=1 Tax=Chryseolinea sp. T2 TaxID=3129255 RepID=UPI0030769707
MSFVENNPLLKGHRGMLGSTLVFRQVNGRTVISARPKKRDKPTAHQLKTKAKFMLAVEYAKAQMSIPELKEIYKKAVNKNIPNAYTAALKDYLNAPVVDSINAKEYKGRVGDILFFHATDDFQVMSVTVEIRSAAGELLEKGEASERELHRNAWEYKATVDNTNLAGSVIVATAKDRAANSDTKEMVLS